MLSGRTQRSAALIPKHSRCHPVWTSTDSANLIQLVFSRDGPMSKVALITGANRGIGLALAKSLKQRNFRVFGACRKASKELEGLGVEVIEGS